jgi:hypothetical protein
MPEMSDLVAAVRMVNAADGDPAVQAFAEQRAVAIVAQLDIGAEVAYSRGSGGGGGVPAGLRGELGSWGEALVAEVAAGDGWVPIYQAVKPGETGLDLVLLHPATEQLQVVEVKTTKRAGASFTVTKNKEHRQVSDAYLQGALPRAGLENVSPSDVRVRGVQVNLGRGEVRWFSREDGEARTWRQASVSPLPVARAQPAADVTQPAVRKTPRSPDPPAGSGHEARGKVIPGDRRIPAGNRRFAC